MKKIITIFTFLLLTGISFNALAQPANDECSGAITVTPSLDSASCTYTSATTVGATQSAQAGCDQYFSTDDDIWYTFTANGEVMDLFFTNIDTAAITYGLGYAVYETSCSGSQVACEEQSTFGTVEGSTTITCLTSGNTYYLRLFTAGDVANYGAGTGTFDFCLAEAQGGTAANDECSNAIAVSVAADASSCTYTNATTVGATQSCQTASCINYSSNDDDVWYSFTASSEVIDLSVINVDTSKMTYGIGFTVYDACGGTEVACNEFVTLNADGTGSEVSGEAKISGLTSGGTYYISFFSSTSPVYGVEEGTFDFCLAVAPPPPANDQCADAISITHYSSAATCNSVAVNTQDATQSSNPALSCASLSSDDDVWYTFTATNDTAIIEITNLNGFDQAGYALYAGSCAGAEDTCNVGLSGTADTIVGLTSGTDYYLAVYTRNDTAYGQFDLCVYAPYSPGGNTAPVAQEDNHTTPMDSTVVADVQANDSDPEGDVLTTSIVTNPVNGTATVLNGDSIEYTPNASFIGLDSLQYKVCDAGLCDFAWVFVDVLNVGINEVGSNLINIYPNPTTGKIYISTETIVEGTVSVYNVVGEVVAEKEISKGRVDFDLSDKSEGIYLIKIKSGDAVITKKVVLQK